MIWIEHDVESFLAETARLTQAVAESGDPYESGIAFMSCAMSAFGASSPVNDWAAALYLIWGSLTDGIDGPQADADAVASWATSAMRRAAAEWILLKPTDSIARTQYLDRWVYEECGYKREGTH